MLRRPTGSLCRVAQPGLARFVLRCNACDHEHVVSQMPIQWQCTVCREAYTVAEARYVPNSTYYERPQENR